MGFNDQSGNPNFVDVTRNLGQWWLHTQGGSDQGSYNANAAAALTALRANPALIGQATTGLLAWVRAGFAPTNVSLHNAAHDGTDIGAIAYQSSGSVLAFLDQSHCGGFSDMGI